MFAQSSMTIFCQEMLDTQLIVTLLLWIWLLQKYFGSCSERVTLNMSRDESR